MRRKSRTSAWRRSISSTNKTLETPGQAHNLLLFDQAAAADTAAEAAAAEAAAAEAAEAALEAAEAALEAAEAALEAAAEAGEAAAAAAGAGAGAAAAAGRGEVAPPGARLEGLAITLTDASRHARV